MKHFLSMKREKYLRIGGVYNELTREYLISYDQSNMFFSLCPSTHTHTYTEGHDCRVLCFIFNYDVKSTDACDEVFLNMCV